MKNNESINQNSAEFHQSELAKLRLKYKMLTKNQRVAIDGKHLVQQMKQHIIRAKQLQQTIETQNYN